MRREIIVSAFAFILSLALAVPALAESATPEEVVAKTKEAAEFLASAGPGGLEEFNTKGRWAWKDTYVFVFNCGEDKVAAHVANNLIGNPISGIVDKKGNYFALELCVAGENPNGGWVEYWWPKPGADQPVRKISYILKVPGQPYEVGAGIYDESKSLDELNGMLK